MDRATLIVLSTLLKHTKKQVWQMPRGVDHCASRSPTFACLLRRCNRCRKRATLIHVLQAQQRGQSHLKGMQFVQVLNRTIPLPKALFPALLKNGSGRSHGPSRVMWPVDLGAAMRGKTNPFQLSSLSLNKFSSNPGLALEFAVPKAEIVSGIWTDGPKYGEGERYWPP